MTLSIQFISMAVMVAGGVQLALTFDTYKQLFRPAYFWRQLGSDLLFFITQACILFYFLYLVNGGLLKLYLFLAILLGISIYYALLQQSYLWLLDKLVRMVKAIINQLVTVIHQLLIRPIVWIFLQLKKMFSLLLQLIKKLLMICLSIVWWLINPLIPNTIQEIALSYQRKCSKIIDKLLIRLKTIFKK